MIKVLEEAIEKVKTLSEERRLVREGLAELDAGRIVSDADMETFWQRHRT